MASNPSSDASEKAVPGLLQKTEIMEIQERDQANNLVATYIASGSNRVDVDASRVPAYLYSKMLLTHVRFQRTRIATQRKS